PPLPTLFPYTTLFRSQALREPVLQARHVGVDHLLVDGVGEDERDVDADARSGRLADGGDAFGVRGNLDEEVGPVHRLPEPLGFLDRKSTRLNSSHVSI